MAIKGIAVTLALAAACAAVLAATGFAAETDVTSALGAQSFEKAFGAARTLAASAADDARQRMLDSALRRAAGGGDAEEIRRLVKLGANPNADDRYDFTPLASAVISQGYAPAIEALIASGADVNHRCALLCGGTAMSAAASAGNLEAAQILVSHHAEVDVTACLSQTPLIEAADRGHPDMVAYLLQNGADPNAKNADAETSLMLASKAGTADRIDSVAALLSDPRTTVNDADKEGMTALKYAVKSGSVDLVTLLLKAPGIDVNDNNGGVSALFLADVANNKEIADLLRAAGARSRASFAAR